MKKIHIGYKIVLFLLSGILLIFASHYYAQATTASEKKKLLRHVVLFKFKDTSSPEDIKKVEEAFRGLPSKIKQIKSLEWGTNNSPENLNQGFTHCFFVTFASEKDREIYLPHPDHKAFGAVLRPHLDKVLVVDYWAEK
ncbi:Dabb family protein [Thermoflexibacter ruber]|uniref:Stress responsive A/B Barrel Domain n=1 Tax=Thermoflexibacter ruber TaxID=1003 RepID=A0A1I2HZG8_9BACT|nr:Dabb family protein [Thermoflexibacter ruber]SFF34763.1 Stress responsive A/B Barrel Domain [Thermoflexibacter ruber]